MRLSGVAGNLAAAKRRVEQAFRESRILFRWIFAALASQTAHKDVVD
jgi:hypothetical protein